MRKFVRGEEDLAIKNNECHYIRDLDARKKIFGSGFIIATQITQILDKLYKNNSESVKEYIPLSERELKILQELNKEYDNNQEKNKAARQNKA